MSRYSQDEKKNWKQREPAAQGLDALELYQLFLHSTTHDHDGDSTSLDGDYDEASLAEPLQDGEIVSRMDEIEACMQSMRGTSLHS